MRASPTTVPDDRGRREASDSASTFSSRPGPTSSSRRSPRGRRSVPRDRPGPGALTLRLAPRVAALTAVEIDPRDGGRAGAARAVERDDRRRRLPRVRHLALAAGGSPVRVAGNLPYNVSSPILFRLLAAHRACGCLVDATLMLQREVAERLRALVQGRRDYGVLSILIQLHADVRPLLEPAARRVPARAEGALSRRRADAFGRPPSRCRTSALFEAHGSSDVHPAAQDAWRTRCQRFAEQRGLGGERRARRAPASTRAGGRRRCNSQNWRGLRRFSVRADD